jgi:antitoxin CptB
MNQPCLPSINQLRWMCRRGLLELDLLLMHIVEQQYPAFTLEQQQLFIELLSEADTDLLAWLLNQVDLPEHWHADKVQLVEFLR